MPTAAVPSQRLDYVILGPTNVLATNPVLFLKVGSTMYSNGYVVRYNDSSYRRFFPVFDQATSQIRLYCYSITFTTAIPAMTLTNIEVLIAN